MNKKIFICILIGLLLNTGIAAAGTPFAWTYSYDKYRIEVGEKAILTIQVTYNGINPVNGVVVYFDRIIPNVGIGNMNPGESKETKVEYITCTTYDLFCQRYRSSIMIEGKIVGQDTVTGENLIGGDYFPTPTIIPAQESIPEFPTIALPLAAIIGMVFLFQRRKGK